MLPAPTGLRIRAVWRASSLLLASLAWAGCGSDEPAEASQEDSGVSVDASSELIQEGGVSADGAEEASEAEAGPVCNQATQPATAECAACTESMSQGTCKAETDACQASTDCAAVRVCADKCGTFQCMYDCIEKNPAGKQLFITWRGCVDTACHDPCHCPDCRLFNSSPCQECVAEYCVQQCLGCDTNAACMAAMYCRYFECEDPNAESCWKDCTLKYPGSEEPFYALVGSLGCLSLLCGIECSKQ